jgi:hypothetical protein
MDELFFSSYLFISLFDVQYLLFIKIRIGRLSYVVQTNQTNFNFVSFYCKYFLIFYCTKLETDHKF